jgi:hypothetical protein
LPPEVGDALGPPGILADVPIALVLRGQKIREPRRLTPDALLEGLDLTFATGKAGLRVGPPGPAAGG